LSDTKTASWIAALERARAELERALAADGLLPPPRGPGSGTDRPGEEHALGTNPVYRCWQQLNEAIDELRRRARAVPATARRRVSLRDVLERIRGDADLPQGTEPQADVASVDPLDPPAAPPVEAGSALPEAEEATVSFVIREPARPQAPAQDDAASAAGKPLPPTREPEPNPGAEAEVVIVPRRR
jgi:hypothetical protein